jgi:hypothetical protein
MSFDVEACGTAYVFTADITRCTGGLTTFMTLWFES